VHVLLIDDDPKLSAMLKEYLEGEGVRTSTIFEGKAGAAAALSGQYDAIILDIMLPGIDGNEVLRQIRLKSSVPVIMLTAKGGDVDRVVGLEMGADDYVAKPYFPRELVARLRAVMRRHREPNAGASNIAHKLGMLELTPSKREVLWAGKPFELTTSEFDLLDCLLGAGETVSSKEDLSQKVLSRPHEVYDRSIDVHVSNLRKKLAKCTAGAVEVETIRGVGYRIRLAP
jgi:two-component system OmpR family response regulator